MCYPSKLISFVAKFMKIYGVNSSENLVFTGLFRGFKSLFRRFF